MFICTYIYTSRKKCVSYLLCCTFSCISVYLLMFLYKFVLFFSLLIAGSLLFLGSFLFPSQNHSHCENLWIFFCLRKKFFCILTHFWRICYLFFGFFAVLVAIFLFSYYTLHYHKRGWYYEFMLMFMTANKLCSNAYFLKLTSAPNFWI